MLGLAKYDLNKKKLIVGERNIHKFKTFVAFLLTAFV
jgi:hypothetical protein